MVLLGRQQERDTLQALLGDHRVVAVLGPAGVGKSALARSLDDVIWVDLEEVRTAEAVDERVAVACGAAEVTPAAIRAALDGARCVALDGAEDALEVLQGRIAAWEVPALLTTRRAPPFAERILELGPLAEADGAQLLRRGVRSVRRARSLDEQDLRAISRAFDGVPLALELLAPQLALYSPRELLARVELAALTDPRRRPRHQSLQRALQACAAPLSPPARDLLAHVAHLGGPFDRPTAERLAGQGVDGPLMELMDAALVHPLEEEPPRFRVLAPVREMARRELDGPRLDQAVARLAEAVLPDAEREVERLMGQGAPDALAALTAMARTLELLVERGTPEVRARAALALGARERRTGPFAATVARDPKVEIAGPLGVRWGLLVAAAASHLGQVDLARQAVERLAPWLGPDDQAAWLSMRAVVAEAEQRLEEAVALHREAVARSDDPQLAYRLGVALFWSGAHEEAARWLGQAAHHRSDRFGWVQTSVVGRVVGRSLGEPPAALLRDIRPVRQFAEEAGYIRLQPMALLLEGVLHVDLGEVDEGARRLDRAIAVLEQLGERDDAFSQRIQRQTLDWLRGAVPTSLLAPQPGEREVRPQARAELAALRGVVLACQEAHEAALLQCEEGLAGVGVPARRSELAAYAAVAFGPSAPTAAKRMLQHVTEPLRSLAERGSRGERLEPGDRWETRTLAALAARHAHRVTVSPDGSHFTSTDGEVIDLSRKKVLRRMLGALARADRPLGVAELVAEVWPGERLVGDSGTRRVHVAISSLRALGLRPVLHTVEEGGETRWWLDAPTAG